MTKRNIKHGIYEVDHTKFGGLIYLSDFNTVSREKENLKGSPIASRIESDARREEKLYKNAQKTDNT